MTSRFPSFRLALLAGTFAAAFAFLPATSGASDTLLQVADSHDKGQGQGGGQGGQGGGQGGHGQGGQGQGGQGEGGQRKGKSIEDAVFEEGEDEESDRPEWAGVPGKEGKPGQGNTEPGGSKGDLYGDIYVVLRDPDTGLPILDENNNVQPILIDGTIVQLTPEGDLPEEYADLVQPVEFGRLNVGRAPWHVLDSRYDEVLSALNDEAVTSVSVDASGRLVITSEVVVDGVTTEVVKTIDAPLENLAIYVALMNSGTLEGVELTADQLGDLAFLTDGVLTNEDILAAASFLAASADKGETFNTDLIVYYNLILDVAGTEPLEGPDGTLYYDFTDFTYDRASVYDGLTAEVLVLQDDGVTWLIETVDIYATLFGDTNYVSDGGVDGFVQATADSNLVVDYLHEFAIPETE